MIRLIILIILFGCDNFLEENAPLNGIYYIDDGWDAFENGVYMNYDDVDDAHELFSAALVGDDSDYYAHAYVGLGWTSLYYANTLIGLSSVEQRALQRDASYSYFKLAEFEFDRLSIELSSDLILLQNYYDYLSGMTFHYSYKGIDMAELYYSNNNDQSYWHKMEQYADSLLSISDELISLTNNSYDFIHDSTFNNDNIRWLRAQTYVRLGDLDLAIIEANSITSFPDCLNIIDCLNNCTGGNCSNNVNP